MGGLDDGGDGAFTRPNGNKRAVTSSRQPFLAVMKRSYLVKQNVLPLQNN